MRIEADIHSDRDEFTYARRLLAEGRANRDDELVFTRNGRPCISATVGWWADHSVGAQQCRDSQGALRTTSTASRFGPDAAGASTLSWRARRCPAIRRSRRRQSTRRAILELLSGSGELTVNALIEHLGVTQQAVAKHLGILERAGLVICRRNGGRRANYYRTRPSGAAPLLDWLVQQQIVRIDQLTTSASRELDKNVSSDSLERALD
jgi:DNA-binding transcriptional ArsR family regulator